MSQISKEIFDKIRTRFSNVSLGDSEGNTTLDSDQAVFFEFDYKDRGNIVVNLQDDLIKIYFNNDMVAEMDSDQSDNWHAWLRNMRKYAHANMLNFEVKNIDKQRLDRKDFEYLVKNSGEQEELTMESKMYGSKKKSYQDLNGARMIVKHARTVDEEKRGARSRNISAVYIENAEGERFKFPNTYLPAARAMTRHISNGGYPNDERGKHILDIMAEMMDLRKFSRRTKRTEYTEEAREIISDATDRYYGLKDTLEGMKKQTGYETYFENWSPDQIEVDENDLEDLKIKLTREVFDDELSDTLSNVGKAVAMGKQKRMEDEERMGSEAQNLKQFAAGADPIMMHPNPEGDAELRNYQMFIKNSNMPVEKRNLAMVQRIMMELSNRMVDDALASAIGRLDMDNSSDAATAFAMAKKYLKGETQIQEPKAKKDRYGKDKPVESWDDFERAVESTVEESVVQEGTWGLPINEKEANEIAAMMNAPIPLGDGGNDAIDTLGGLIGDDELWDDLGVAADKDPKADARPIIIGWMMEHVDDYDDPFKEAIKMALAKIKADGNDTMVIPRTFGNRPDRGMSKQQADAAYNTSATQGERMGSNAAQIKQNEDAVTENAERIIKVTNIDYAGPALDKLPTETTLKLNIPYDADEDDIYDMVADELEDRHGVKVSGFDMNFAESIEEGISTLKCKHCGDMLGHPTTNCAYDSMDPKGKNWIMVDLDMDGNADMAVAKEDTVTEGYEKMVMNACKDAGIDCGFRDGKLIVDKEDMAAAKKAIEDADMEVPEMVAENIDEAEMSDKEVDKFHKALDRLVHKHLGHSSEEEKHMDEGKMKDIAMHIEDMINDGASDAEIMAMHPEVSAADIKSMRKDTGDRPGEYDESLERMKAIAGIGSNAKSNHGIREGEAGYQITPRSIVAREMRKLQDLTNK